MFNATFGPTLDCQGWTEGLGLSSAKSRDGPDDDPGDSFADSSNPGLGGSASAVSMSGTLSDSGDRSRKKKKDKKEKKSKKGKDNEEPKLEAPKTLAPLSARGPAGKGAEPENSSDLGQPSNAGRERRISVEVESSAAPSVGSKSAATDEAADLDEADRQAQPQPLVPRVDPERLAQAVAVLRAHHSYQMPQWQCGCGTALPHTAQFCSRCGTSWYSNKGKPRHRSQSVKRQLPSRLMSPATPAPWKKATTPQYYSMASSAEGSEAPTEDWSSLQSSRALGSATGNDPGDVHAIVLQFQQLLVTAGVPMPQNLQDLCVTSGLPLPKKPLSTLLHQAANAYSKAQKKVLTCNRGLQEQEAFWKEYVEGVRVHHNAQKLLFQKKCEELQKERAEAMAQEQEALAKVNTCRQAAAEKHHRASTVAMSAQRSALTLVGMDRLNELDEILGGESPRYEDRMSEAGDLAEEQEEQSQRAQDEDQQTQDMVKVQEDGYGTGGVNPYPTMSAVPPLQLLQQQAKEASGVMSAFGAPRKMPPPRPSSRKVREAAWRATLRDSVPHSLSRVAEDVFFQGTGAEDLCSSAFLKAGLQTAQEERAIAATGLEVRVGIPLDFPVVGAELSASTASFLRGPSEVTGFYSGTSVKNLKTQDKLGDLEDPKEPTAKKSLEGNNKAGGSLVIDSVGQPLWVPQLFRGAPSELKHKGKATPAMGEESESSSLMQRTVRDEAGAGGGAPGEAELTETDTSQGDEVDGPLVDLSLPLAMGDLPAASLSPDFRRQRHDLSFLPHIELDRAWVCWSTSAGPEPFRPALDGRNYFGASASARGSNEEAPADIVQEDQEDPQADGGDPGGEGTAPAQSSQPPAAMTTNFFQDTGAEDLCSSAFLKAGVQTAQEERATAATDFPDVGADLCASAASFLRGPSEITGFYSGTSAKKLKTQEKVGDLKDPKEPRAKKSLEANNRAGGGLATDSVGQPLWVPQLFRGAPSEIGKAMPARGEESDSSSLLQRPVREEAGAGGEAPGDEQEDQEEDLEAEAEEYEYELELQQRHVRDMDDQESEDPPADGGDPGGEATAPAGEDSDDDRLQPGDYDRIEEVFKAVIAREQEPAAMTSNFQQGGGSSSANGSFPPVEEGDADRGEDEIPWEFRPCTGPIPAQPSEPPPDWRLQNGGTVESPLQPPAWIRRLNLQLLSNSAAGAGALPNSAAGAVPSQQRPAVQHGQPSTQVFPPQQQRPRRPRWIAGVLQGEEASASSSSAAGAVPPKQRLVYFPMQPQGPPPASALAKATQCPAVQQRQLLSNSAAGAGASSISAADAVPPQQRPAVQYRQLSSSSAAGAGASSSSAAGAMPPQQRPVHFPMQPRGPPPASALAKANASFPRQPKQPLGPPPAFYIQGTTHIGLVLRELGETEDEGRDLWRYLLRRYRERGAVAGPLGPNAQALIAVAGPPAPPAPPAAIPPTNFDGDEIDATGEGSSRAAEGDVIEGSRRVRAAAFPHVYVDYRDDGSMFNYGSEDEIGPDGIVNDPGPDPGEDGDEPGWDDEDLASFPGLDPDDEGDEPGWDDADLASFLQQQGLGVRLSPEAQVDRAGNPAARLLEVVSSQESEEQVPSQVYKAGLDGFVAAVEPKHVVLHLCFGCTRVGKCASGEGGWSDASDLPRTLRATGQLLQQVRCVEWEHVYSRRGQPWKELVDAAANNVRLQGKEWGVPKPLIASLYQSKGVVGLEWLWFSRAAYNDAPDLPQVMRNGNLHVTYHHINSNFDDVPLWQLERKQKQKAVDATKNRKPLAADITLKFGSANVFTLGPAVTLANGQKTKNYATARSAHLPGLMEQQQYDLIGIQESRTREAGIWTSGAFLVTASASDKGHGGCELWVNLQKAYAKVPTLDCHDRRKRYGRIAHTLEYTCCHKSLTEVLKSLSPYRGEGATQKKQRARPLPKVQLEDGTFAGAMKEVSERWQQHFAKIEVGEVVDLPVLRSVCVKEYNQFAATLPQPVLENLPTLTEVGHAIRKVRKGRAVGEDMLPSELFQKGVHHECGNSRAILIQDAMAKFIRTPVRSRLYDVYEQYSLPLQLGGKKKLACDFACHLLREHQALASNMKESAGAVFVDITSAFYSVIKQLCHDVKGVGQHLEAVVGAFNHHTWFSTQNVSTVVADARGSRPGDTFGDVLFNFIAAWMLKEINLSLTAVDINVVIEWSGERNCIPAGQGSDLSPLELNQVAWVDDIVFLFRGNDPTSVIAKATVCKEIVVDTFAKYGFAVNLKPGKTECLLMFRGKEAAAARHQVLNVQGAKLPFNSIVHGKQMLNVVLEHVYLGSTVDYKGSMTREMRKRASMAMAGVRQVAVLRRDNMQEVRKFHETFVMDAKRAGLGIKSLKNLTVPKASSARYQCTLCPASFDSEPKLNTHAYRKHGYKSPMRLLASSNVCLSCGKEYHTRSRILQHLNYMNLVDNDLSCVKNIRAIGLAIPRDEADALDAIEAQRLLAAKRAGQQDAKDRYPCYRTIGPTLTHFCLQVPEGEDPALLEVPVQPNGQLQSAEQANDAYLILKREIGTLTRASDISAVVQCAMDMVGDMHELPVCLEAMRKLLNSLEHDFEELSIEEPDCYIILQDEVSQCLEKAECKDVPYMSRAPGHKCKVPVPKARLPDARPSLALDTYIQDCNEDKQHYLVLETQVHAVGLNYAEHYDILVLGFKLDDNLENCDRLLGFWLAEIRLGRVRGVIADPLYDTWSAPPYLRTSTMPWGKAHLKCGQYKQTPGLRPSIFLKLRLPTFAKHLYSWKLGGPALASSVKDAFAESGREDDSDFFPAEAYSCFCTPLDLYDPVSPG
ncbi:unnamed protein product [Polarella glacialis]|uniref:C2H2-type domain-containing protein n=1 Tax=Polarella glacialis TaxID=89957 RepID=A0A813HFG5_POLGL|nr:unnamed protein product [Polarella glacialis]